MHASTERHQNPNVSLSMCFSLETYLEVCDDLVSFCVKLVAVESRGSLTLDLRHFIIRPQRLEAGRRPSCDPTHQVLQTSHYFRNERDLIVNQERLIDPGLLAASYLLLE